MKTLLKEFSKKSNPLNYSVTPCINNLAVTPSQMMDAASAGVPIASQLLDPSYFDDGSNGHLPIEPIHTRGYSVIDAWNDSLSSKKKLNQINNRLKNFE